MGCPWGWAVLRASGLGFPLEISAADLFLATEPKPDQPSTLPSTCSSGDLLGSRGRCLRVSPVFFHNIVFILKRKSPQLLTFIRKRRQELFAKAKASVCGQATQSTSETSRRLVRASGVAELLGWRKGQLPPVSLSALSPAT